MKKTLVALACAWALANANAATIPECFLGRWKSDETLTLQDMREHVEVTRAARELFERKFFGKLVVVIGRRYTGAYFEGESDTPVVPFDTIDVVDSGTDWVTLRDRILGTAQEQRWFCDEGRIYTRVSKWQFKEFFLPLP